MKLNNNLKTTSSLQVSTIGLKYTERNFKILDQTQLPEKEIWLDIKNPEQMLTAIKNLSVRGAPLLAVAAALSFYDWLLDNDDKPIQVKKNILNLLKYSRPTAVNLLFLMEDIEKTNLQVKAVQSCLQNILKKEFHFCEAIANQEKTLISSGDNILTYCNTGELATLGLGTALGVIKKAFLNQKKIHVYVSETRPLNQGSRLTLWELEKYNIPSTLICDNTAASLMSEGKINKVFVGADRIAINGDTANKVGTYALAILAKYHNIPFYVVAPENTFDANCTNGAAIPIEQRLGKEVSSFWYKNQNQNQNQNINIVNYAFDITPVSLITAIITNKEILKFKT